MHWHLKKVMGETVNTKKIRRIMDEYGLKAVIWKGFKVKTTDSDHEHGYAPNLLPGKVITGVNQVWVTDITYICITTGFVYLAAILDLFSRKVIGWAISKSLHHSMCLEALKMAIETRKPPKGCIHHSDRGVQYACPGYREFAQKFGLIISMSAKGYCYDNAFMESWFKTLRSGFTRRSVIFLQMSLKFWQKMGYYKNTAFNLCSTCRENPPIEGAHSITRKSAST